MSSTNKLRRVNKNQKRMAVQTGGHGLPSAVKKRKKRKKVTATQMAYAPRGR